MTLKTINGHTGKSMTGLAKMFTAAMAGEHTRFFIGQHMAINTLLQTECFGAYTLVHGFISLVQKIFHVIFPHIVLGTYATIRTRFFLGFGYVGQ